MAKFSSDNYGIIGVGSSGEAVIRTLAAAGKNVIAIDSEEEKLKELGPLVSEVYMMKGVSKEALEDSGIGNCATVIIGMGENLKSSILATMSCIEIGVPRVISKAGSFEHGRILEKLGAEVVFPEEEAGERLARKLISHANLDMLPLSEDFSIAILDLNPSFVGKTILELDWRRKFNINVIAVITEGRSCATITPDMVFPTGCRIVISGTNEALEHFRNVNAKGME